jgi:hypothetical protein
MLAEHNPIAELIHKIQTKWMKEATPFPHLKLVRWLIKPEEARLYEGFLKLESTEHGALPEMLVTMLTPFEREDNYAADLYADWMKALKADQKANQVLTVEQIAIVEAAGAPSSGQPDPDARLLKMLGLFQQQLIGGDTPFVLALLPRSIHDMEGYRLWLIRLLKKGIPAQVSLMVFDHIGAYHLDGVVKKYPEITKSLSVILDMDGAVSKIVKAGNPNAPEVKLNECILEMGKGVQQNNPAKVDEWGEKALQITQRSGQKSLFATAHSSMATWQPAVNYRKRMPLLWPALKSRAMRRWNMVCPVWPSMLTGRPIPWPKRTYLNAIVNCWEKPWLQEGPCR